MTVEERLKALFPTAKQTTLKQMVQTGRIRLGTPDGPALRRLKEVLPEGMDLAVLPRAPEPPRHRKGDLQIVFEDDHLLVVAKPPGLLTATNPHEKRPTLLAKVTEYLERTSPRSRVGLIHRLDKDARGLLVFSKNEPAYFILKEQLKERTMGRGYHAVVLGIPRSHTKTIESRLVEPEDGKVYSTDNPRKGEPAVTHYEIVSRARGIAGKPEVALLKVKLETGRKHQIRVHLSEIGHPIKGDVIYGNPPHNFPPLLLAATNLLFKHPATGKLMTFDLPVPREFEALFPSKGAEEK